MIRPAVLLALPLLLLPGCDRTDSGTAATAEPVASATPAAADSQSDESAVVIAAVDSVEPGGEPVDVALQTQPEWGTEEAAYRARVPADAARVALRFDGVRPGRYAAIVVQPNAPEIRRPGSAEAADPASPAIPRLPSLQAASKGGRGVSNSDMRAPVEFATAAFDVQPDGTTVPLTVRRR